MQISVQVLIAVTGMLCSGCHRELTATDTGSHWRQFSDMETISTQLQMFRQRTGRLPSTEEGLRALVELKLISEVPNDAWGNPYQYAASPANKRGYDIFSLGPDRKPSPDDIHLQ